MQAGDPILSPYRNEAMEAVQNLFRDPDFYGWPLRTKPSNLLAGMICLMRDVCPPLTLLHVHLSRGFR